LISKFRYRRESIDKDDHNKPVHGKGQDERHQYDDNRTRVIGPTPVFRINENNNRMDRLIRECRAYTGSNIIQKRHFKKELSESCVLVPDANMKRLKDVDISISLFVEQDVGVTDTMINQAKQLACVLTGLAKQVFKFPIESLHLFQDIDGCKLAHSCDLYYLILVCL
jgi:hypothetical protein